MAATKAAEMKGAMEESIKRKFNRVFLWTDSECVLKQIADKTTRQKPFVANRLSKIRKFSGGDDWRFVDSKNNPADMCSRGIQAHEVEKWKFYLEGPDFLRKEESQWPERPIWEQVNVAALRSGGEEEEEEERGDGGEEKGGQWWLEVAGRKGTWEGKLRLMVCLRKVGKRWRMLTEGKRSRARSREIEEAVRVTKNDYIMAEVTLVKAIQSKFFAREIKAAVEKGIRAPD